MRFIWVIVTVFAIAWVLSDDTKAPSRAQAPAPPIPKADLLGKADDTVPLLEPDKAEEVTRAATAVALREPPSAQPAQPRAPTPDVVYVTGSVVNLRKGPGTQHKVLWKVPRGTQLYRQASRAGWSKLQGASPNGPVVGWMSSRYVSSKRPAKAPQVAQQKKRHVAVPSSAETAAIRKAIIRQSIASYPGSCACPYNRDRAGRRCGKRSAWSKPGGYSPICYDSDITNARLQSYLARRQ